MRGNAVLNFHTMKANILDELENSLQHRRTTDVVTPYFFLRDVENKKIRVVPRLKKYSKVFDKRVVNTNASSYPYGYRRVGEEVDLLMEL